MRHLKFVLAILISGSALAQEANDLAKRTDFLNRSDYMRREYLLIRNDLQKPGGYNDRYAQLNSRLLTWVNSWGAVKNLIDNPPASTLTEMEALLTQKLNRQTNEFANIQMDLLRLMLDLDMVHARLSSLKPIEYRIERYDLGNRGQAALEQKIGELSTAVSVSSGRINDSLVRINEATDLLRVAFNAKITADWAQKGVATLDQVLRLVEELELSRKLLEPLERSFLESLGRYQMAYSSDRLMEAVDFGREVVARCQSFDVEVNKLPIADRYKTAGVARLKKACDAPVRVIDLLSKNPARYVASAIVNKRRPRIESVCGSEQSYLMNCRLYSAVSGLSVEQIQGMTPDQLRQLEAVYLAIETNKRRGNIF